MLSHSSGFGTIPKGQNLKYLKLKYLARLLGADKYQVLSVPWRAMRKGDKNLGPLPKFLPTGRTLTRRAEFEMGITDT